MAKTGVYIHVPFCARKCLYCDFYSCTYQADVVERYCNALAHQISGCVRRPVSSVYFGGGTPSLLPPQLTEKILSQIARRFDLSDDAEITIECNPETVNDALLRDWHTAGINRLSIGAQTMRNTTLARIGRRHKAEDTINAITSAAKNGFTNISADLMLGLPGETMQNVRDSLREMMDLPLRHLSCYLLKLASGTPLGDEPPDDLPDADSEADVYLMVAGELRANGFAQYEISNFAREGAESRHNLLYWNCDDYFGFGPAAHSSLDGKRYSFAPNLSHYLSLFEGGVLPFCEPLIAEGDVTAEDFIMMQLRLAKGLCLRQLRERYGAALTEDQLSFLRHCAAEQLVEYSADKVCLTPAGMLVSNSILVELI